MLSIYYQNVNRMRSKLVDFRLNLLTNNYDVVCLTETNLNKSVFDGEVFDSRYAVFRRDRVDSSSHKIEGGGVLIAVQKKFEVIRQASWDSNMEDVWVTLFMKGSSSHLNICVCYLPPDLNYDKLNEFYSNCQKIILNDHPDDDYLLLGDFNQPDYISAMRVASPSKLNICAGDQPCTSGKLCLLEEFMNSCNLIQFNYIQNNIDRILDLVLSNLINVKVGDVESMSRLDKYHPAIIISLSAQPVSRSLAKCNNKQLNFNKCDYNKIKNDLRFVDWSMLLSSSSDINKKTQIFYDMLFEIIARHTPLTSYKYNTYPVWFSKPLINCIIEKNKYHKMYKKFGNPRDYDVFSMLRHRCKMLTKECYKRYIASTEESLQKDTNAFWRFINNRKGHVSIPNVVTYAGDSASNGQSISELFSRYFGSVFVNDHNQDDFLNHSCTEIDNHISSILTQVSISESDIQRKIKQLDGKKGPGPDKLPPSFIKTCGKELSVPLNIIFNSSLRSGTFPSYWKTAHIIPIHKSGDKSCCENYRPISILSCFAKLFESLVYVYLYNHMKPLISSRQHGFVKNRSTISNLLEYKHYLCQAFATRGQVDSIYTDFSKAFDKVCHRLLCRKLFSYGVHGNLYRWICSYLENRSQLVALKGFVSAPVQVGSGVPQGSHLGPLLFIIFINDLIEKLSCSCLLYADDLKVYNVISQTSDCLALQKDLDIVSEWCKVNHMHLNINKCSIITFTNKKHKIIHTYTIEGETLKRLFIVKDLGIYFDEKLSFREHYEQITSRANKLLGFVLRSSKDFKNPRSVLYLYFSLVRSVLEYGSPIWSPNYRVHINTIERVQMKCLRLLSYRIQPGRSELKYEQRLLNYNMQSLENRRTCTDLIYLYKIIHSLLDSPELLSQISLNIKFSARRVNQNNLFALLIYKNNISYYNPITRMCRTYNELARSSPELDIFTCRLVMFRKMFKGILHFINR